MNAEQLAMTGELEEELDENATAARELLSLPCGLHLGVPDRVYHARVLGLASKSALDELRRSPAHYRAWVSGERTRSGHPLHIGKAAHCAILEPARFAHDYVIEPSWGDCRIRDNKLARDRWKAEHKGSTILRNEDGLATMGMVRALVAHPGAAALIEGAFAEATLRWDDGINLVPCKGRLDIHRPDLRTCVDVKTSTDASAESFRRDVWNYGYHRQDAFYRSGCRAVGHEIDRFLFIVVEKAPPYAVAIYELDERAQRWGHDENERLLARLADHIARDEWPGYPERIQPISLPRWAEERI